MRKAEGGWCMVHDTWYLAGWRDIYLLKPYIRYDTLG